MRALIVLGAFGLGGCLSSGSLGTARTLDAGQATGGFTVYDQAGYDRDGFVFSPVPAASGVVRVGLGADLEIGGELHLLGSARFSLKYNPIRGELFDLAIAASGFFGTYGNGNQNQLVTELDLPLIADLNLWPSVSVVQRIGPGIVSLHGTGYDSAVISAAIGLNIRVNRGFSIQPELAGIFEPRTGRVVQAAPSIAFVFGATGFPD